MGMWRDFQPAQQNFFLKTITYGTFKTDIKYISHHSDYNTGNAGHNLIYYTQRVRNKIK